MPELPEVETVVNGIKPHIFNQVIKTVWRSPHKLRASNQSDLAEMLEGKKIIQVSRKAKYIALHLDSHFDTIIHLGMSGKLIVETHQYQPKKHDHVILGLSDGTKLVFNDARRFGMFFWHESISEYLKHYGKEPLSDDFNTTYLHSICMSRTTGIKQLIMDQKYVVGVGNIYACEALFSAHIMPRRASNSLSELEVETLVNCIKAILNKAIEQGGTTLKDYRTADNTLGYFQQRLAVYSREGDPCYVCGSWIRNQKISGRSTFFCDHCQS
ncbi:MAG: bifunctional DNA-formamidopyrimidine glycosylase/DNA-(apurinic or apyrimidinic site) lyase [Pseudomonadota bacterium]|nr:bifunctional DNA-formamidopyrimidine glycosylase/DNA-(apurinic or apyrimidinic site) lyase [Pseudomonadota bacterium]